VGGPGLNPNARPGRGQRLAGWIIGIVLSGVFFALAARGVDWRELWRSLPPADQPTAWLLVGVACLAGLVRMPARAVRWLLLVRPLASISLTRLTWVTTFGTVLDNLLPARAGDFGRAAALQRDGVTASGAFATIVVERVVDVLATQMLVIAALLVAPMPPWLFKAGMVTCAIALFGLLALVIAVNRRSLLEGLIEAVGDRLGPVGRTLSGKAKALLDAFLRGASGAMRAGHIPGLVGWSAPILLTGFVPSWCVIVACDLFDPWQAIGPAIIITTFAQFAVMLPAAPGQVGTVHFAGVAGLALFGVEPAPALACMLVLHATQFLPVTVLGAPLLWREGVTLAAGEYGRTEDERD